MKGNSYKDVFENTSNGVLVLDTSGDITLANQKAAEMLNSTVEDLVGQKIVHVLPTTGIAIQNCLKNNTQELGLLESKAEGSLLVNVTLISEDPEENRGAIINFQETLQIEKTAQKLDSFKKLHTQFQAIFDNSSDGIWVCDPKGTILAINRASEKLNNITSKDFIGKHVSIMEDKNIVDANITPQVIQTKQKISMMQYVRSTGRHIMATANPAFDESGNLILVIVNERDVTQLNQLQQDLEESKLQTERAKKELANQHMMELQQQNIVAENKAMSEMYRVALKLSKVDASSILILGDSGTGKGLMSKFIHQNSNRAQKSFIHINCAALPESLLEAELFGYEPGAFTGAKEQGKAGLFELAHEGTLFLDEIGEMPLLLQAKLLTYLDTFEVLRLGGTQPRKIDCQLIAATNLDLADQVGDKKFRHDLFHRLSTFTIKIPSLKERPEDVFELTNVLLQEYNEKYKTDKVIRKVGMETLQNYSFPGNARELQNILKEAVVLCDHREIDQHIVSKLTDLKPMPEKPTVSFGSLDLPLDLQNEINDFEKKLLQYCVDRCTTTSEVANASTMSQATAFRKLKKHGIKLKSRRGRR